MANFSGTTESMLSEKKFMNVVLDETAPKGTLNQSGKKSLSEFLISKTFVSESLTVFAKTIKQIEKDKDRKNKVRFLNLHRNVQKAAAANVKALKFSRHLRHLHVIGKLERDREKKRREELGLSHISVAEIKSKTKVVKNPAAIPFSQPRNDLRSSKKIKIRSHLLTENSKPDCVSSYSKFLCDELGELLKLRRPDNSSIVKAENNSEIMRFRRGRRASLPVPQHLKHFAFLRLKN